MSAQKIVRSRKQLVVDASKAPKPCVPSKRRLVTSVLIRESGAFIHKLRPWSHWATLTFRDHISYDRCKREMWQRLHFIAQRLVLGHVWFAFALDKQARGVFHFHLLIEIPELSANQASVEHLDGLWRRVNGHTRIELFDPTRGAAWYMVGGHNEWDVHVACPRRNLCRRPPGRCVMENKPSKT